MSNIVKHFGSRSELETVWSICLITGLFILILSASTFIRVLQHLICIPDSNIQCRAQPKHIRIYSIVSITFAVMSVFVTFSEYLVCAEWDCGHTNLGWIFDIFFWTSYSLAKLFLNMIFVGRLFNRNFRGIYEYPHYIQYFLWILVVLLLISMIALNIEYALLFRGVDVSETIDAVIMTVYLISDWILSTMTTILFFRPICCRKSIFPNSDTVYISIVNTYGFISVLQLVAAVSFELSCVGQIYFVAINAPFNVLAEFNDICNVIQMLDCLLLMICIYIGFARKQTVCELSDPLNQFSYELLG